MAKDPYSRPIAPLNHEIHRGLFPSLYHSWKFFKKCPSPNISLSCAIVMHKCIKYPDLPFKINNEYA